MYSSGNDLEENYEAKSKMNNMSVKTYNKIDGDLNRRIFLAKGENVNEIAFKSWKQQLIALKWEVEMAKNNEELTKRLKSDAEANSDKTDPTVIRSFQTSHTSFNRESYRIGGLYVKELNDHEAKYAYDIVVNKKFFADIDVEDGWQNKHSQAFESSYCHFLQADVDLTFYERTRVYNNVNASLKVDVGSYHFELEDPSGLGVPFALDLKNLIVITMVLFTVRGIVFDKEYMKDFMAVMGVTDTTFYISHVTFLLFKQIIFVTPLILVQSHIFKLNVPLVLLSNIVEFFVIIAFTLLMSSLFKSSAVTTMATVVSFFSLMIWAWMGNCTPQQEGYCLATFLNPLLAKNMFISILTSVKITHKSYSMANLFEWKSFHYPGAVPLAFMVLDTLLMLIIFIVVTKGKQFSCRRNKVFKEDDDKKHVFSNAEEEVDKTNAVVDIQIKDVTKVFKTGQRAVHGLNLEALRGQVTVLLGHNGAGKTTTFSMICGTEKATEGTLEICGQPAGSAAAKEHIGYCSQQNTILGSLTVEDHLKLAYNLKCANSNFSDEMHKLLKLVGLLNYQKRKAKTLSGGQKRKLCLCMALIGESSVVLLDEPTAGMDLDSRQEIETFLDAEKGKRTILLTTHYMDEAECLGDRVFIMSGGRVVCSGSPDFLKKRFASGYTLTVLAKSKTEDMKPQAQKLKKYIENHVKGAKLGEIRGVQIDFELSSESHDSFPSLFEDLEQNKHDLDIASFGLSMGNLEQVFLKVGHAADDVEDKEKKEERVRGLLKEVYEDEYVGGGGLLIAQFAALFQKKLRYSLIQWPVVLFVQLGLPLLVLFVFGFSVTEKFRGESVINIDIKSFGSGEFLSQDLFPYEKSTFKPNFEPYLNEQLQTNEKMKLVKLKGQNSSEMYRYTKNKLDAPLPGMAITYGIQCNQEKCTNANRTSSLEFVLLRYNLRHLYSLPTALNVFANAKLRNVSQNGGIQTSVRFFAAKDNYGGLGFVFLLTMLMALVFATLTEPLAEDVTSGFMSQQILARAPGWLYWTVEYIYAFLLYAIQCSIYLTSFYLAVGLNVQNLVRAVLLTVVLFYSAMPLACWLSNKCKTASSATVTITMILALGIIAGAFILSSIVMIMMIMKLPFTYIKPFMYIISAICPSFPFLHGMSKIVQIQQQQDKKETDSAALDEIIFDFHMYLLVAVIMGTLHTLLFVLDRFKSIRRRCSRNGKKNRIPRAINDRQDSSISSDNVVLDVQDLSKVYRKHCALAHVSFKVQKNECFGLLGVSGAGKTTAFNIITGQMFATDGSVILDGVDINQNIIVGLCPQFDTLQPTFKGKQSLAILAKIHGYKDINGVVEKLIEIVDMEEHAGKDFKTCSGGQKRRLSVAAALLPRKSPFVILDEATAGIDPVARRDVWSVLSVVREHSAILMSSHSMEECDALCNRISILRSGQIAASGSSQELKSKLGNFYVLSLTLSTTESKVHVPEAVVKCFPGATIQKGSFFRNMKWKLPRLDGDMWSNVFERCQKIAQEIGADDFCVSQPSLQDIFLIIATHSENGLLSNNDSVSSSVATQKTSTGKPYSESAQKTSSAGSKETTKEKEKEFGHDTQRLNKTQKSASASGKQTEMKEDKTSSDE